MKKVLINVEDRELRVAILEDDQLTELYVESLDEKTILNNVYKGRIEGIIPGLKAAFVNVGLERNAFLHFEDVRTDLLLEKMGITPPPPVHVEDADDEETEQLPAPRVEPAPLAAVDVHDTHEDSEEDEEVEGAEEETESAPGDAAVAAAPGQQGQPYGDRPPGQFETEEERRRRRRGRRGGRRRRRDKFRDGEPGSFEPREGVYRDGPRIEGAPGNAPDEQGPREDAQEEQAPGNQVPRDRTPRDHGRREHGRRDHGPREHGSRDRFQRRDHGPRDNASPGNERPRSDRPRDDRQPFGPPQQPGMPPPYSPGARAAFGTRAAANPYDVYSPYAQPKGQGKGRRQRPLKKHLPWEAPLTANDVQHVEGESQEDFFPPPSSHERLTYDAQAPVAHEEHFDEDYEGPAPGNEKVPPAGQAHHRPGGGGPGRKGGGGGGRNRGKRRVMRRRGPSYYAARKKKDDAEQPNEQQKPKARARKADVEPAKEAAEKKPRGRKAAAETVAEAPAEKKAAAKSPRAKATKKAEAAEAPAQAPAPEEKPARKAAGRGRKAQHQPAAAAPDVPAAQAEEAPKRGRRRKADATPGAAPDTAPPAAPPPGPETAAPANAVVQTQDQQAPITPAGEVTDTDGSTQRPYREGRRGRGRGQRRWKDRQQGQQQGPAGEQSETQAQGDAHPVAPPDGEAAMPVSQSTAQEQAPPAERAPFERRPKHGDKRRDRDRGRRDDRAFVQRPRRPLVTEALKKGDEIMVQVIKEEIGLKGARISSYISLPGRYLVLLPYPNEEGGVSRKVENIQERKRLKQLLREISGDNMAFIIRTAGVDRSDDEIRTDVEFLTSEWRNVEERYKQVEAPALVYNDRDILYRLARDVFDESISEIHIDSHVEADKLKAILGKMIPDLVDRVHVYTDAENIFHRYEVEKQIQKAARRKVWLKSGGYLIIDEAEALTAIDVNTGKFIGKDDQEKMILKTNLEACKAIARELKLRDIGGLIVIDFIDMRDQRNRDQVLNEFKAHLRRDRSKTSVSNISEFGLVEMTRKRVRQSLRKTLFMDCPYCQGSGVILNERQIWMHIKHELVRVLDGAQPAPSLNIVMNPKIRTYIDQTHREALAKLEQKYSTDIRLSISDVFHVENYAIEKVSRSGERIPLPVGVEATMEEQLG